MAALYVHLREGFVATHEVDLLAGFKGSCIMTMLPVRALEKPASTSEDLFDEIAAEFPESLDAGRLDLHEVCGSDYFFS